jgi:hypothetical protein
MAQQHTLKFLLLTGAVLYIAMAAIFGYSFEQGPNNRNVTIDARVNITNAPPIVLNVIINGGATNITLNAGSQKRIECNATVLDYNGGSTVENVTAQFFASGTSWNSSDDNNTHYTNATCSLGNYDAYTRNVSCGFNVQYHTNAGAWRCNVTAIDPYSFNNASKNQSNYNTTFIDALLALNVTQMIDYGDLATGDLSAAQQANVTNLGNRNINISVRGFGNASFLPDGIGMYCEISNIPVYYQKFNLIGGADIAQYTNLTNTSRQITGLTVLQQTNDSQQVINSTNWVLFVPPGPFGRCNGTIVFQAESS